MHFQKLHCLCFGVGSYFTLQLEWNYFRRTSILAFGLTQEATGSSQWHFSVLL